MLSLWSECFTEEPTLVQSVEFRLVEADYFVLSHEFKIFSDYSPKHTHIMQQYSCCRPWLTIQTFLCSRDIIASRKTKKCCKIFQESGCIIPTESVLREKGKHQIM